MPDNYFARYLPFLIHILLAGGIAAAMVVLSWLIGQRKPTRAKLSPYECGMIPVGDSRERFSVKFYLVAMLFILFDVEAVFLYPWAVATYGGGGEGGVIPAEMKNIVFWEIMIFLVTLALAYVYAWRKGVFQWR